VRSPAWKRIAVIRGQRPQAREGSFLQCIALSFEIAEGGADEYSKGSRWLY